MKKKSRSNKKGVNSKLTQCADKLKYDDGCKGEAVEAYKERLIFLAETANKLESAGFEVSVDCKPEKYGYVVVHLLRNKKRIKLFSEFYDTFESKYLGNWEDIRLERKVSDILKIAEICC